MGIQAQRVHVVVNLVVCRRPRCNPSPDAGAGAVVWYVGVKHGSVQGWRKLRRACGRPLHCGGSGAAQVSWLVGTHGRGLAEEGRGGGGGGEGSAVVASLAGGGVGVAAGQVLLIVGAGRDCGTRGAAAAAAVGQAYSCSRSSFDLETLVWPPVLGWDGKARW